MLPQCHPCKLSRSHEAVIAIVASYDSTECRKWSVTIVAKSPRESKPP